MATLIAEAAVGAVFGELLRAVWEIKSKAVMFKETLDNLESTLNAIDPVIKKIEQHNKELGRSKKELESLKTKMGEGTKLVLKCSNIHWLCCVRRAYYKDQLESLEKWLLRFFLIEMQAQMASDIKETLLEVKRSFSDFKKLPFHTVGVSSDPIHRVLACMLTARNLVIAWGDNPGYWRRPDSVPGARSSESEVAELVRVCWLDIRGLIKTSMLSPNTLYGAYFVFKRSSRGAFGFKNRAVEVSVKVAGEGGDGQRRMAYLEAATPAMLRYKSVSRVFNRVGSRLLGGSDAATPSSVAASPSGLGVEYPKERSDGWMEVELGDFFSGHGEDKDVEMGLSEVKSNNWKGGIVVQGMEIRPKLEKLK